MSESLQPTPEIIGPKPAVQDILRNISFKEGRVIPNDIDSIDISVFQEDVRTLANACFNDPHESNAGKFVDIRGNGRIVIPSAYFKAVDGGLLALPVIYPSTSKAEANIQKNNDKFPAMLIHTQNNENYPFSPSGMFALFQSDDEMSAVSSVFIIGRSVNMLLFRGTNTPQLPRKEAEQRARLWNWQLEERTRAFTKPGMSFEDRVELRLKACTTLQRQINEKYDLRYFAAPTDSSVVYKQELPTL
ncbi:MAG TPA: hypothetical protein VHE53_02945 [Patescibacteria group bacterium]|nr:hypothetical protein [Patescibacteria group bacterium]